MNKERIKALRENAPISQLKAMKSEILTRLDSYTKERERCVVKNSNYINYGLNRSIIKNIKSIKALELLIKERSINTNATSLQRSTRQKNIKTL